MKITDYILNLKREDVASYYELRSKHEERSAFMTIFLATFCIFVVIPLLFVKIICDCIDKDGCTWFLEAFIIMSIIFLLLCMSLTLNAYRCGRLFRTLRKNKDLGSMLRYATDLGEDKAFIHLAYIIHFKQYVNAYMTDKNMLVVVYMDDGIQTYYETCDYKILCDRDCQNAVLLIDNNGISLMNMKD